MSALDEYRNLIKQNTEALSEAQRVLKPLLAQNVVRTEENMSVTQRHSEILNNKSTMNALEDQRDETQYALSPSHQGAQGSSSSYPPRRSPTTGGNSVGRGDRPPPGRKVGFADKRPGTRDFDKPDPLEEFPFKMPRTVYNTLPEEDRAGLKKESGIDGPNHPMWNTTDWTLQPNGRCQACGKERCNPPFCLALWAQSAAAKERPEEYRLKMRGRLLWHSQDSISFVELRDMLEEAAEANPPRVLAAVSELQSAAGVQNLLYRTPELGHALELAPQDGGRRLCALAERLGHEQECAVCSDT